MDIESKKPENGESKSTGKRDESCVQDFRKNLEWLKKQKFREQTGEKILRWENLWKK